MRHFVPVARRLSVAFSVAFVLAPVAIAACSAARYSTEPGAPTLVLPARFAEGKGEAGAAGAASSLPSSVPLAPSASAPAVPAPHVPMPITAPDPLPLRQAEQVEYEFELNQGKVSVVSVRALTLPSPVVTPRRLGRYAVELSIGPELIERVRFDFPGTAADEPQARRQSLSAPLTLSARAVARAKVLLPQSPRVRRAVLVDRALNVATELEWPLPRVPRASDLPPESGAARGLVP